MQGCLLLEDGTLFQGTGLGASGIRFGEVIFSTSMTGYQELLTDPSYRGQILISTAARGPHVTSDQFWLQTCLWHAMAPRTTLANMRLGSNWPRSQFGRTRNTNKSFN